LSVTTSYPTRRGDLAGHFVHALNSRLVAKGHEVTVVAPHAAELAEQETRDGVSIVRFRYGPDCLERVAYGSGIVSNLASDPRAVFGLLGFAVGLRLAVRRLASEFDVIHVNWAPAAAIAGSAIGGRPLVVTLHGSDVTLATKNGLWRKLLAAGVRRAKRVVVVARSQEAFLRASGLTSQPVSTVPCGVDEGLLARPDGDTDRGNRFEFLFGGRLVGAKGVMDLLEAFIRLARVDSGVYLAFAGAGPAEPALRDRAAAAQVSHRVRFLGLLDHEASLDAIAAADAFVLPSYGEGSPLALTEALALGTPAIGTRVGGVPDLLGVEGLLIEAGDVSALTAAMVRLRCDGGLREHLVCEGRKRVAAAYTWPRVADAYERVYREVAGACEARETEAGSGYLPPEGGEGDSDSLWRTKAGRAAGPSGLSSSSIRSVTSLGNRG